MKTVAVTMTVLALVIAYGATVMRRQHEEEKQRLLDENAVLWEQVARFNEAWVETRARQAVTN